MAPPLNWVDLFYTSLIREVTDDNEIQEEHAYVLRQPLHINQGLSYAIGPFGRDHPEAVEDQTDTFELCTDMEVEYQSLPMLDTASSPTCQSDVGDNHHHEVNPQEGTENPLQYLAPLNSNFQESLDEDHINQGNFLEENGNHQGRMLHVVLPHETNPPGNTDGVQPGRDTNQPVENAYPDHQNTRILVNIHNDSGFESLLVDEENHI